MKVLAALVVLTALVVGLAGCEPEARRRLDHAEDLSFRGEHAAAMAQVERAMESIRDQASPEARALRLEALFTGGRLAHLFLRQPRVALAYYRRLVEEYPDTEEAFVARERMARIHIEDLDDRPSAINHYQSLVSGYGDRPGIDRYQLEIAKSYFTLGEYEQARGAARTFLERFPQSKHVAEAKFIIGSAWQAEAKYDEATEAFRVVYDEHPGTPLAPRARLEEGNCLVSKGEEDAALEAFVEALRTHPEPQTVQYKIAKLRARMNVRKPGTGR